MPSSGSFGSGGVSFATPGLTLTTANAAGVATTTIRSDASVLTYDATVPGTIAPSAAAAAGAAAVAARRDHTHGAPSFPVIVGVNTAEQTTTSASAVDMVTISGLTISVDKWIRISIRARKSASAAQPGIGLKLNSTVVIEAATGVLMLFPTTNEAMSGTTVLVIGPRVANYLSGYAGYQGTGGASGTNHATLGLIAQSADFPSAEITSVIIRGISDGATTLGVDDVTVETW